MLKSADAVRAVAQGALVDRSAVTAHSPGWTSLQLRTVALCFIVNMLDGADVLIVSFVAPLLSAEWRASDTAFGVVFSSGLAGMTVGALLLAPFADVLGRRPLVLLATAGIAAGMMASAQASSIAQLVGFRFVTGIGIGAMLASVTALASEYAPPGHRSSAVTFVTAGYPAGATLAGLVGGWAIPQFGWAAMFMALGLLSAALLPVLFVALPESAEFTATRRSRGISIPPVRSLVAGNARLGTLLVWGAFVTSFFTVYFLTSWIPRIAVDAGYPLATAIRGSSAFNIGALLGLLLLGILATRLDLTRLIVAFFLLSAVAMMGFALWHEPASLFYAGMILIGFLVQGAFGGLYAVAAQLYPPESRSTGVGWSIGLGRLGGIAGPTIGGIVFGAGLSLLASLTLFAIPLVAAAAFTWLTARYRMHSAATQS